jgi:hypothetical protein
MLHIPQELEAGPDDVVEVALNGPANVLLLDPANYDLYRQGKTYHYQGGGFAKTSPFQIVPPTYGRWFVVIDLGGYPGHVRAWVRVLQGAHAEG